jgi:hypothetical protein
VLSGYKRRIAIATVASIVSNIANVFLNCSLDSLRPADHYRHVVEVGAPLGDALTTALYIWACYLICVIKGTDRRGALFGLLWFIGLYVVWKHPDRNVPPQKVAAADQTK